MIITKFSIAILILFTSVSSFCQDVSLDKKLGAENDLIVKQQMGVYQDSAMTAYVAAIGNRLVSNLENSPFEYQFLLIDDPTPNAFALPGGYVYVTRGLLALVTSEDELAGVMAHEIMHVEKRHSIGQMKKSILPGILSVPGNVIGIVSPGAGAAINAPINAGGGLLMASYSRKDETEADVEGVILATRSGYDPRALKHILDRISLAIVRITGKEEEKSYMSTHPYTPDRVKKINKTIKKLEPKVSAPVSNTFPKPLDGLVFGVNPKGGVFDENKFMQPELGFSIKLPKEWNYMNMPVALAAVNTSGSSMIVLTLEDTDLMLREIADTFELVMATKMKVKARTSEALVINGVHPARILIYDDNSNGQASVMFFVWVKVGDFTYRITGYGPRSYEEGLLLSAKSIKELTKEEQQSIDVEFFKVIEVNKEMSLESFSENSKDEEALDRTSFFNGMNKDANLQKGQLLKVLVKEDFK